MKAEQVEELAKEAKSGYETLFEVMKEIYTLIPGSVQKKNYPDGVSYFLADFHLTYQFAILNIACSDHIIGYNEITFLRLLESTHFSLEKYLAVALKKQNGLKDFHYEDLKEYSPEKLQEFLKDEEEKDFGPNRRKFIETIAEIQILNKKHYYQLFYDCTSQILKNFLCIDHIVSSSEIDRATDIIFDTFMAPLKMALVADIRKDPKDLKWTCMKGRHFRSLKEIYRHRGPLRERSTAHLVNAVTDPTLLEQATIYIETDNSTGSGFIVTADGRCVTCAHVVKNAQNIYARVTLEDEEKEIHKCELLFIDEMNDFAIIRLETVNHYFFEMQSDFRTLRLGRSITIFGYPFGIGLADDVIDLSPTITKGYISSRQVKSGCEFYFLDAQARPGNSGGPVLDAVSGKVIGYLCGAFGDQENKIVFMRSLKPFVHKFK